MLTEYQLSVWKKRWEALDIALTNIAPQQGNGRSATLALLRDSLRIFGESQFHYFADGVDPNVAAFRLARAKKFPPEYIFNILLEQLQDDYVIFLRAVEQRERANQQQARALLLADLLVQGALAPAEAADMIDPTVVVTYFEKSKNTRLIPYAPVSLVGVPVTTISTPNDYLAIPHEVGHYVYRNGELDDMPIADRLSLLHDENAPEWLLAWQEEIFADVYGTLVTGAVMAVDFQDLLLTHSLDHFRTDDGEHPVEALRPFIYTKTLELMGHPQAEITELNGRWQAQLDLRGNPAQFEARGSGKTISILEARALVDTFVTKLFAKISRLLNHQNPHGSLVPLDAAHQAQVSNDLVALNGKSLEERLYGKFKAIVEAITAQYIGQQGAVVQHPNLPLNELAHPAGYAMPNPGQRRQNNVQYGVMQVQGKQKTHPLGRSQKGLLRLLNDPNNPPQGRIDSDTWQRVLDADGWAFRGPQCQGSNDCG